MSEKKYESRFREAIKKAGGLAIKFFVVSWTGFPDRIVLMPGGRVCFVELKSPGDTPSPRQKIVHSQLRRLGFRIYLIDSDESYDHVTNEIILLN